MSPCGSNAGMEMSAPLISAVFNNTVPLQLMHQTDSASNHQHPALFLLDSLPHILKKNCSEVKVCEGQKSGSSYKISYYCTSGLVAANDAQNVRADTARGKDKNCN